MDSRNLFHTQSFKVKVISPVHVGTGAEYAEGLDYTTKPASTIMLDANKISARFVNDPAFLDALSQKRAEEYLNQNQVNLDEYVTAKIPGKAQSPTLREQISDVFGNPYLPGSSIKGALRTALFHGIFNKQASKYESALNGDRAFGLESEIFAPGADRRPSREPNFDYGRVVRIPDVPFLKDHRSVINTRVINRGFNNEVQWKDLASRQNKNDYRSGTPVSAISLATYSQSNETNWSIDHNVLKNIRANKEAPDTWLKIASMANEYSRRLAEHHVEYFDSFSNETDDSADVIAFYEEDILGGALKIAEQNVTIGKPCFLLQVGWGTGWNAKTGFTLDKHIDMIRKIRNLGKRDVEEFPKTRKVTDEVIDGEAMLGAFGWILVEPV
jgi:CRISPR-associated protein Csm5